MGRISLLPQPVADRIAAGEVVERPASALRELLDNALDAGAGRLEIELGDGGRGLLAVADDGCGMDSDDAVMAFERHATSKVSSGADLERISTLGFRGEALAAIAAVSRVELTTAEEHGEGGTRVVVDHGRVLNAGPSSRAPGTTVSVRGLFRDVPARRKFLKSPGTELEHCLNAVRRAALARPAVGFRVRQSGRTLFGAAGGQDLSGRLREVIGAKLASRLVEVERSAGGLRLRAYVSPTDLHRYNRNGLRVFLNSRPVRDPLLTRAVLDVYRPFLPSGRFPLAILMLELPPEEVDVNVHPAKSEVRFERPREVRALVVGALTEALAQRSAIPSFGRERLEPGEEQFQQGLEIRFSPDGAASPPEAGPSLRGAAATEPEQRPPASPACGTGARALAQYRNTFILAEDERGLLIVDQHVAHERLLYEELSRQADSQGMARQGLVFPRPLEAGPRYVELALEHAAQLERLGFGFESFGGGSLVVREVPAVLGREARAESLLPLLERLDAGDLAGARDLFDHLLATVACHAAVKKGYPLTAEKMEYLLEGLALCEVPGHCPHGRAISLRVDLSALNARFERS